MSPLRTITILNHLIAVVAIALTLASCGGGGGGGGGAEDGNYLGYTEFQVERDSLDSGDLTDVTLTVHDINKNGLFVKFHYPYSLAYQPGSGITFSGDMDSWVNATPFTSAATTTGKYLVFRVSRPPENETNRVGISFTMRAISGDPAAYIEIDLDNNDPTIPDKLEFDPSNPQFSATDRWNIKISGSIAATPTPSATGSVTPAPTGSATPAPTGSATPAATATPKK